MECGKRRQRNRHTPDVPAALEYLPASQEAHVADELAPVALEYLPAVQETHADAPDSTEPDRVWGISGHDTRPSTPAALLVGRQRQQEERLE